MKISHPNNASGHRQVDTAAFSSTLRLTQRFPAWVTAIFLLYSAVSLEAHTPTSLEPEFNPPATWQRIFRPALYAVQPDGRIIACEASGLNILRLNRDGSLEARFPAPFAPNALAAASDGRVLLLGQSTSQPPPRLIQMLPSGEIDRNFVPPADLGLLLENLQLLVRPDRKILLAGKSRVAGVRLVQLHPSGALDSSFQSPDFGEEGISRITHDGLGVLVLFYSGRLIRLLPNGSKDTSFQADMKADSFLLCVQPGRGILVTESHYTQEGSFTNKLLRLNFNGSPDSAFQSSIVPRWLFSLDDGRLLAVLREQGGLGSMFTIISLAGDGAILKTNSTFHVNAWDGVAVCETLHNGRLLVSGPLISVNGVPRAGMARILVDDPPTSSFTVTPLVANRFGEERYSCFAGEGGGPVTLLIQRQGDLSNALSVSFATTDGTARSPQDFSPASETIFFAPMEAERRIQVGLQNDAQSEAAEVFRFEAYSLQPEISAHPRLLMEIFDDEPRLTVELPSDDRPYPRLRLRARVDEAEFWTVQASTDLQTWSRTTGLDSFELFPSDLVDSYWQDTLAGEQPLRFYRAVYSPNSF